MLNQVERRYKFAGRNQECFGGGRVVMVYDDGVVSSKLTFLLYDVHCTSNKFVFGAFSSGALVRNPVWSYNIQHTVPIRPLVILQNPINEMTESRGRLTLGLSCG